MLFHQPQEAEQVPATQVTPGRPTAERAHLLWPAFRALRVTLGVSCHLVPQESGSRVAEAEEAAGS
jgi:hypothetical protein